MRQGSVPGDHAEGGFEGFDRNSGVWLERLLFNNRILVILLCLLATVVLAFQATKIQVNAGYEKMIPAGHEFVANYLAHKGDLSGLGNSLRIVVETTEGTIFDASYMETLRKINDEVFLLQGVERSHMKSLWTPSVRWVGVTEEGMEGGSVIPDNFDGSRASLNQLRTNVERSGQVGQLVANDFRSTVIVLPLLEKNPEGKKLDYYELSQSLEQLRKTYETESLKVRIVGFAKVVGDLIEGIREVMLFLAITVGICAIVLFWHTRCVRSTLLVLSCSLLAVLWLLGLLPTLGYELDPYSILIPFLVFAIGMSHGAQKMNGIMQDVGRGAPRLVAARNTFRRLFVAGLTALLADVVGFAVLMTIDIQVIRELAVGASIGVAVLIFTNLVLLPILLSYTGVSATAAQRSLREEVAAELDTHHRKHPLWAALDHFTRRQWAIPTVMFAVLMGAGAFVVALNLQIGDLEPGAPELRSDSRYNRDNAFVVSRYAASSDIYVVMVKTQPFQCNRYDLVAQVDELEWKLQQLPQVESTNSFAALARMASAGMNEGSFMWYDLPRTQGLLNSIAGRGAPRELINQNCDLMTVYVYLKDHKAETLDQVVQVVTKFADEHDTAEIQFLSAAGSAGIEAATNIVVKQANNQILLLVYAAVTILAFVTFRSWRAVICAVLPLTLTTILAEALMVILGIGVKVATLPVIALGVGIGVDYSLYVMSVTLCELRLGRNLSEAYYKALQFTGKVVVLTGLTLAIAVGAWIFSPIKFQADMGVLLAFMFLLNMLGALILLPALTCIFVPVRIRAEPGKPSSVDAKKAFTLRRESPASLVTSRSNGGT